jgi:hypothetical protein
MPSVSATMAGRGLPSTSMVISLVTRKPLSSTGSTLTSFWRSRTRAPAGTGAVKRTRFEP